MAEQQQPHRQHLEDPAHISEGITDFAAEHGLTTERQDALLEQAAEQDLQQATDELGEALHASRADDGSNPVDTKRTAERLHDSIDTVSGMLARILGIRSADNNDDPGSKQ